MPPQIINVFDLAVPPDVLGALMVAAATLVGLGAIAAAIVGFGRTRRSHRHP